jgi:UDP-2,3-diacylglucosamine hydrolase
MMKSIYVVSDMHMFCTRSRWQDHLQAIHEAAGQADLFVFNGDTFDFKWSILPSPEETVEAAVNFLRGLAKRYPKCQFHVNLGNHDYLRAFIHALDRLSREVPNLSWHPYFLRVGSTLFIHGDVAIRKMNHRQLEHYRERWMEHKQPPQWRHDFYDVAFRARAHVYVSRIAFPRRLTLRRVSAYLSDIGHSSKEGVQRVYFGHTHVPMSGYCYRGVTYHNGGAPMTGVEFSLLKVKV